MPLIKPKYKSGKKQISITLDNHIAEKINQYCEWAKLEKINDFFEQAAEYVLSKDKDWAKHNKQKILG